MTQEKEKEEERLMYFPKRAIHEPWEFGEERKKKKKRDMGSWSVVQESLMQNPLEQCNRPSAEIKKDWENKLE